MNNLKMFCITLEPSHFDFIKKLNYIPVGLGQKKFSNDWLTDRTGKNIFEKNRNYGEYTFHYWLWKNYINQVDSKWIGFGQYRKFWTIGNFENDNLNIDKINSIAIQEVPSSFDDCEVILGKPFYVNQRRVSKFLKNGFKLVLKKPGVLFSKKYRNLKFHFDLMHGENNLKKAIDLLDSENKSNFEDYMNQSFYFHPHNMFICGSKELLIKYYETIFPWLEKCENVFGFKDLTGYGLTRIYGFLAERFLSYWFTKNARYKTMDIAFYDINNDFK
tara:strand:+ start:92 stop:913 length:822 start_codon:yes stop_codon:yes gene_type:complete